MDVAWSPFGVDGRNYDALGLAAAADVLFVMAYDMQSQVDGAPMLLCAHYPLCMHMQPSMHQHRAGA